MAQNFWPKSYSSSSSLIRALFIAQGDKLSVVGELPDGVSIETLRPFISESFRASQSTDEHQHAWLNLTDGSGQPLYVEVVELGDVNGAIGICSSFPAFKLLHEILMKVICRVQDVEESEEALSKYIHTIVHAIPPAMPGVKLSVCMEHGVPPLAAFSWAIGDLNPLDDDDISLDCISAASLVGAWEALMFERPVVVVSSNALLLTPFVTFLNALLSPLHNAHPTVPILPPTMIDILEAPFPFLVGVRSDTFYQLSPTLEMASNMTVLDLDTGLLSVPGQVVSDDISDSSSMNNSLPSPTSSISFQESSELDMSNPSFPPSFVLALARKVGCAVNAQRVAKMHDLTGQHRSATKIVKAIFAEATAGLLGPRYLPLNCSYDMLADSEEDQGLLDDPTLMAAHNSEKTALSKLSKGIITELEYKEIVSHNAAIVAESKAPSMPCRGFQLKGEVPCGGLFTRLSDKLDDTITKRMVWSELDGACFNAWPFQSVVPSIFIKLEQVTGISVSPALPDGCCFSISIQQSDRQAVTTYLFEAPNEYSAEQWINYLEKAARLRGGAKSWMEDNMGQAKGADQFPTSPDGLLSINCPLGAYGVIGDGLSVTGSEFYLCRRALLETQHISVLKSELREMLQLNDCGTGISDDLAIAVVSLGCKGSFETAAVSIDSNKVLRKVCEMSKTITSTPPKDPSKQHDSRSSCGQDARLVEEQIYSMCSSFDYDPNAVGPPVGSPELRSTLFGRVFGVSRSMSNVSSTDSLSDDTDVFTRLCKLQSMSSYFLDAVTTAREASYLASGERLSSLEVPLHDIWHSTSLLTNIPSAGETQPINNKWRRIFDRALRYDPLVIKLRLLEIVRNKQLKPDITAFNSQALSSLESVLLDEAHRPVDALKSASKGLLVDVRRNRRLILNVMRYYVNSDKQTESELGSDDGRAPLFEDDVEGLEPANDGFTITLMNILENTRKWDSSLVLFAQARLCTIAATRFKVEEYMNTFKSAPSKKSPTLQAAAQDSQAGGHLDAVHSMIDPEYGTVLNYGPLQATPTPVNGSDAIKIVSNLLALLVALVRFQQPVQQETNSSLDGSGGGRGSRSTPSLGRQVKDPTMRNSSVVEMLGAKVTKSAPLLLTKDILRGVSITSGFTLFVKQSWQLQDLNIGVWLTSTERTDSERLCFLLNLYNLMTLHGMVVRGPPSTTVSALIGRCIFSAGVRYRVGEMTLDLVQVEHALLRAGLCQVSLSFIGAIGSPARPFAKSDLRDSLRLRQPPPELSFGLCTFTLSSPLLYVFREPSMMTKHLEICTTLYIKKHIKVDMRARTVFMSEYLQWFSKDFGGSKREALRHWLGGLNNKQFQLPADFKIKVVAYNWNLGCDFVQSIETPRSSKSTPRTGSLSEASPTRSDEYWAKGSDRFGW